MSVIEQDSLKEEVRNYWNSQPCGTQFSDSDKYTREYFDDIETHRYGIEPDIFSFAQFTRHHGKKVLEVGIGAGSDFLQWVRAGARAYGIDATPEGVNHVKQRLEVFGLQAEEVRVADCESLPYKDNEFDLVYSWGVIHHTPDTPKALREIVRVCRPGGTGKVMIYHRHSLLSYFVWVNRALLAGKPWKSLSWCLYNHMESLGTKAYTIKEAREMFNGLPVKDLKIRTRLTYYDRLERFGPVHRLAAKVASKLFGGDKAGWFMLIEFEKKK